MCNTVYGATKRRGSQRADRTQFNSPSDQSSPLFSVFFQKFSRGGCKCSKHARQYLSLTVVRGKPTCRRNNGFKWRVIEFFERDRSLITSVKFRGLSRVILFSAHSYTPLAETHSHRLRLRVHTRVKLTIGIINFSRLNTYCL